MATIDLNQLRAARAEQAPEPTEVIFGDPPETFTIPGYMDWPAEITELLITGDLRGAFREMMGEKQFERFWRLRPSVGDLYDLMDGIEQQAGMDGLGEAPGSWRSSPSTSGRSRPTSPTTTLDSRRSGRASRKGPSAKRPGGSGG